MQQRADQDHNLPLLPIITLPFPGVVFQFMTVLHFRVINALLAYLKIPQTNSVGFQNQGCAYSCAVLRMLYLFR